jgi:triacylglycerol lipase
MLVNISQVQHSTQLAVDHLVPRLSAPIVLVHGLRGLDAIFRRPNPKESFPGVRSYLEAVGNRVLVPRISPTAGVETRASELRSFIRKEVGTQPVHLIGHSLGGLDARYMISRLGMESQVLSLTTVGTPHRGTAFADWCINRFARFTCPLLRKLGVPDDAFFDVTTDACLRFNETVPDAPDVRYFSIAGVCSKPWLGMQWWVPARIVRLAEGPNDGVVSVASANWGEHNEIWDGDHLNIINWPNRRMLKKGEWQDRAREYGRLLNRIESTAHRP